MNGVTRQDYHLPKDSSVGTYVLDDNYAIAFVCMFSRHLEVSIRSTHSRPKLHRSKTGGS